MKSHRSLLVLPVALVLAVLGFARLAVAADVSDVTSLVSITKSGLVLNRATNTFNTTVTLTNTSSTYILNPISLVILGLPSSVTVSNVSGTTTDGKPYIAVPASTPLFVPGGKISGQLIKFTNPTQRSFTFSLGVFGNSTTIGDPSLWTRYLDQANGNLVVAVPNGWIVKAIGSHLGLRSPMTVDLLSTGNIDTPSDIGIAVLSNSSSTPLEQFIGTLQNGFYTLYANETSIVINGRSALMLDDTSSPIPKLPAIAVFVDAPPNVIAVGLYAPATAANRVIFENVLDSLSVP